MIFTVGIITGVKKSGGNGYCLRHIHQLVHVANNLFWLIYIYKKLSCLIFAAQNKITLIHESLDDGFKVDEKF